MLVRTEWMERQRETGLESTDGAILYLSRARMPFFMYVYPLQLFPHPFTFMVRCFSRGSHLTYVASIEDHTYVKPDFVAPDQCWCAPGACRGCSSPAVSIHPATHMGVQHDSSAICTLKGAVVCDRWCMDKYVDMCGCNVVQVVLVSACSVYPQYDSLFCFQCNAILIESIRCVIIVVNSG
ncbi:hypothetical protein B0H11DRAFT_2098769 [Mycena galericulata]|nr:hypothetical protein B0H11DRAFT_2098769 [Mycena galericulata]